MTDLASSTVARLGERIFGSDWAAPMARLIGVNARTLLRIKAAAAAERDYPAAKGVLGALAAATRDIREEVVAAANVHGIK